MTEETKYLTRNRKKKLEENNKKLQYQNGKILKAKKIVLCQLCKQRPSDDFSPVTQRASVDL